MVILFPSSLKVTTAFGLSKISFLTLVTPVQVSVHIEIFILIYLPSLLKRFSKFLTCSKFQEPTNWVIVFSNNTCFQSTDLIHSRLTVFLCSFMPSTKPYIACAIQLVSLIHGFVGLKFQIYHIAQHKELVFRLFGVCKFTHYAHTTGNFEVR